MLAEHFCSVAMETPSRDHRDYALLAPTPPFGPPRRRRDVRVGANQAMHPIATMCRALEVFPSGYNAAAEAAALGAGPGG